MMDSACAEYECAAQAETGCWNRNPTACFLYDLCQTVYLSPQICIPAGDVDACLSMVSSLLRLCIFQTALKNTFFHGTIFALWRGRGKTWFH